MHIISMSIVKITFIQSKFRSNENNFHNKEITLDEILKMDVDRIVDGYQYNEDGEEYNNKILKMMEKISEINDIGRYDYQVIILANLRNYKDSALKN